MLLEILGVVTVSKVLYIHAVLSHCKLQASIVEQRSIRAMTHYGRSLLSQVMTYLLMK
jgi:hypothetical protein